MKIVLFNLFRHSEFIEHIVIVHENHFLCSSALLLKSVSRQVLNVDVGKPQAAYLSLFYFFSMAFTY